MEQLKIINRSGEHLLDMIGDVLTLSRIEAGRVDLKPRKYFDFRQILVQDSRPDDSNHARKAKDCASALNWARCTCPLICWGMPGNYGRS